jgi:flagellar biosynthesis/type III secretory pathway protein FliH
VPPAPPEELLRSLQSAVERTAGLRDQVLKETERQLVALAAKIARKVISHELTVAPEIMLALAAEGMDALEDRDRLVVRFGEGLDELAVERFRKRLRADNPRVEVMRDLRLAPWDCVVETELGRVDESVDARLGKVMEALLGRDAGL